MGTPDPYAPPVAAIEEQPVKPVGDIRRWEEVIMDHLSGSKAKLVIGFVFMFLSALICVAVFAAGLLEELGLSSDGLPAANNIFPVYLLVPGGCVWPVLVFLRYWRAIDRLRVSRSREDLYATLRVRKFARISFGIFSGVLGAVLWFSMVAA